MIRFIYASDGIVFILPRKINRRKTYLPSIVMSYKR